MATRPPKQGIECLTDQEDSTEPMAVVGTAALVTSILGNLAQPNTNDALQSQKAVLERLLVDWQQAYQIIDAQIQSAFSKIQELSKQNTTLRNIHTQLLQRTHGAEAKALVAEGQYNRARADREKVEKDLAQLKAEHTTRNLKGADW
jgi:chromosome segregation ATPase